VPRTTDRQKETEDLERRRVRLQDELDRWRQNRAKDVKVYQDMVRNAATNDQSGEGRRTYREMHVQCDRVWVERIQLKKAELAALAAGARRLMGAHGTVVAGRWN
jgi:hypothetical protein